MFNESTYNLSPFNQVSSLTSSVSQDDIVFNGLSLQNENIIISRINFDSSHVVQNDIYNKPLIDGVGELNHYFREKIVIMEGNIKEDNAEALNDEIDRIKRIILQPSKNLDIKVNGVIRRATATCINAESILERDFFNITNMPISLEFRALGFFKEITENNISYTSQIADFTQEVYNDGSARAEPIIVIVFNSATTVTQVKFTNTDFIQIDETFTTGDVLKIDTQNKQVLLNGVEVDYTGTFPYLEPGNNSYTVEIDGTKDFNFNLSYFNTYL